jgi:hypothetical protein
MNKLFFMILIAALGCVLFNILASGSDSSASAAGIEKQTQFSSVYTNLKTDCKGLGGDAPDQQHVAIRCKGAGNYGLQIQDSTATWEFLVIPSDADDQSIQIASQPLDYNIQKGSIEWRMANGKPFAVIMRAKQYRMRDGNIVFPLKMTGESLIVKGLKGYENIDFKVNTKTPGANEKARQLADAKYAK